MRSRRRRASRARPASRRSSSGDAIEGEARDVALVHAASRGNARGTASRTAPPCVLLSGGETTVSAAERVDAGRIRQPCGAGRPRVDGPPPPPCAARHRRLAAGEETQGGAVGWPAARIAARCRHGRAPRSRASALDRIAEDDRRDAGLARDARPPPRAHPAGGRRARWRCSSAASASHRRRGAAARFAALGSRLPYFSTIARPSAKVVGSGTSGRGDHREIVARHVGDGERDDARRAAAAARRPPLIAERCFRTPVHLADRRAA